MTNAPAGPRRLIVGPFNRVEGDLEVRLDIQDQQVQSAQVVAPLYRGFEQILQGRAPLDALAIVPRVCGICSVSQSLAAAAALRDLAARALGLRSQELLAENGRLASNLVHAAENIADHLTHSFVFFLPDFARSDYEGQPWHPFAQRAYAANRGTHSAAMIRLRARLLHVVGLLAGKWPHSLALQPGGTTVAADSGTKARLLSVLADVRRDLEQHVFAAPLERISALDSLDTLESYRQEEAPESSDFRFFLSLCESLALHDLGQCSVAHLSFGAYHGAGPDGSAPLFGSGVWDHSNTGVQPLDLAMIDEDLSHAWYQGITAPPQAPLPLPDPEQKDAYSWCKAPRLAGKPAQTGALARALCNDHSLLTTLTHHRGSSVASRVIARFLEIARLIPEMEQWVRALRPREPFCLDVPMPRDGQGIGLCEAARGALGHWVSVQNGQITDYQIIAPTTWNFSPRDQNGIAGPLEQALVGCPAAENSPAPVAVQHVVRSFDPCMVCTVH
jgi:hydrogenase large subunit